jgi:outer membrane protein assembly factor BamB
MRLPFHALAGIALALAATSFLSGLSACSSTHASAGAVAALPPGELPGLQQIGLHESWQRHVRLEPGEHIKKAWYTGLSVYAATTESRIVRIDAKNGVIKWSKGLGRENFDIYRPIELTGADGHPSGEVLVVTRGEAFVLILETGDEARLPAHLGLSVSADPVVIGNSLCVGGADTFYGLYLDRLGAKHWRLPVPGDLFISAPVALGDNILVASRTGHLWRINAANGDWDWKDRKTNGNVYAGIAADDNGVYVPCLDQRVYAFRSDSGGELWEQQLEGLFEEAPALAGPSVLVRSRAGNLFALARNDGHLQWQQSNVAQIGTVGMNSVWLIYQDGTLKSHDPETGVERASAPAPGVEWLLANTLDNNVILITPGGLVGLYTPMRSNTVAP